MRTYYLTLILFGSSYAKQHNQKNFFFSEISSLEEKILPIISLTSIRKNLQMGDTITTAQPVGIWSLSSLLLDRLDATTLQSNNNGILPAEAGNPNLQKMNPANSYHL